VKVPNGHKKTADPPTAEIPEALEDDREPEEKDQAGKELNIEI